MRPPALLVKIPTLFLFITLIISFVAYRSGLFDDFLKPDNIGPAKTVTTDKQNSDETNRKVIVDSNYIDEMMTSSKSGYVVFPEEVSSEKKSRNQSSVNLNDFPSLKNDENMKKNITNDSTNILMYSSKSAIIIEPREMQKVKENDSVKKHRRLIPGTKSGFIFEPDDMEKVKQTGSRNSKDSARSQKK